jgi:hypothetical protein
MMRRDDIDRLLASEEMLEPSPGFAVSVMSAVRREAETLEPIAFPWRRALPGLVFSAAGLVAVLALLVGDFIAAPASEMAVTWVIPVWLGGGRLLSAAALAGSLFVAWLAVRLSDVAGDTAL